MCSLFYYFIFTCDAYIFMLLFYSCRMWCNASFCRWPSLACDNHYSDIGECLWGHANYCPCLCVLVIFNGLPVKRIVLPSFISPRKSGESWTAARWRVLRQKSKLQPKRRKKGFFLKHQPFNHWTPRRLSLGPSCAVVYYGRSERVVAADTSGNVGRPSVSDIGLSRLKTAAA